MTTPHSGDPDEDVDFLFNGSDNGNGYGYGYGNDDDVVKKVGILCEALYYFFYQS